MIEHADYDQPIIQVPHITIGKFTIGPFWFSRRDDNVFENLSKWTDKRVHGAIGGNVFKDFQMILDYKKAQAYLISPDNLLFYS